MTAPILNLTQHNATADQIEAGVMPTPLEGILPFLNFTTLPTAEEILHNAESIATIASATDATKALIGGAPYLMTQLEKALLFQGITPVYAFTQRESVETQNLDGSVLKTNVFRHIGFVEVC